MGTNAPADGRSSEPRVHKVSLYDPNRNPTSWMDVIQPTQYAVFLSSVETGAELTTQGTSPEPGAAPSCLIFDSLEEAEQFSRTQTDRVPNLQCKVFDSHGRANPPVAIFVNSLHQDRLDSTAKAGRIMRWSVLLFAASLPFFWYTWKTRGEAWIASIFGIQFILLGLRLLHWGHGMKEQLRYQEQQAAMRRSQITDPPSK